MRFAYADPPYLGLAVKMYGRKHPDAAAYDKPETHAALVARLVEEFPDGWALSASSPSLRVVLPMCPQDARVLAWCKPFAMFKPTVRVAYAWEPVIAWRGRPRPEERGTVRDWIACNANVFGREFVGAKPQEFCFWLFEVLGMLPEDEFVDVFPGSGAVADAFDLWKRQRRLFP